MGLAHGEALREQIHRCVEIYRAVFAMPDETVRSMAHGHLRRIERFAPGAAVEMSAIAIGAAVEPHWIVALNARSELMSSTHDGCTAIFVPQHALLGQTWDWLDVLEPLVAVVIAEPDDAPAFVTLTEPGIIAKIGLNAAGIGVCLNYMYASTTKPGVPIHVLLAELLRTRTLDEVDALVRRAGPGRAGSIVIGTAAGEGRCIEYIGDRHVERPLNGPFAHTNHVDDEPDTGGPLINNSLARLARARLLLDTVRDIESLDALLADRHDSDAPINAPYVPFAGARVGTTATVTMDLVARRLDVSSGPDRNPTTSIHLS